MADLPTYETSSLTKEKLFKPPFRTISYAKNSVIHSIIHSVIHFMVKIQVKILLYIQSWCNAQQKLGLLKTLPSAKVKQLITDKILKNY